jgi:hypothetical protein
VQWIWTIAPITSEVESVLIEAEEDHRVETIGSTAEAQFVSLQSDFAGLGADV